ISYNWESFAKDATIAMIDVDAAELKKPTLKIDIPVHADLREALPLLLQSSGGWKSHHEEWLAWCRERLQLYPAVTPKMRGDQEHVNPYYFIEQLFHQLESQDVIVCGDGTACVTAFQAAAVKKGQRLFHNSGCASMGYDLPAAIGAALACPDRKRIICIAGDGSIMMNLQELQTIMHHHLPVKIFVFNNRGYHSIRQTQHNFFADNIVGCGTESGLSFPDFRKIAEAFEMSFQRVEHHDDVRGAIAEVLAQPGAIMAEVILNLEQAFEPKLSSRKLEDGTMITASLEDMAPFLSREELEKNRF
ncbi:MAG: thiamine pyrophosphate-dependent enzyme, partial [Verrucomicrobiota bacterium]